MSWRCVWTGAAVLRSLNRREVVGPDLACLLVVIGCLVCIQHSLGCLSDPTYKLGHDRTGTAVYHIGNLYMNNSVS